MILSLLPVSNPAAGGTWGEVRAEAARAVPGTIPALPADRTEEADEASSEESVPESEGRGGEAEGADASELSEFLPGQRYRSLQGRGDLDRFIAPLIPRSDAAPSGRRAVPSRHAQSFEGPRATCERTLRRRF